MRQNVPAWQGFLYRNLSNKLGIRPAIIKILADRGVETEEDIREFLEVDQSKVSDGSELTDMEKGVSIIQNALAAGSISVSWADVDGVISTYIHYKGLIGLNAKCDKFMSCINPVNREACYWARSKQ